MSEAVDKGGYVIGECGGFPCPYWRVKRKQPGDERFDRVLVGSVQDIAPIGEADAGACLMVADDLAVPGMAGESEERFAGQKAAYDRSNSRMGDDRRACTEPPVEVGAGQHPCPFDVPGKVGARSDLGEHRFRERAGHGETVYFGDQAVEGIFRSHGHEDHITVPA